MRAFALDVAVGNGETSGVRKPHFAAIVVTISRPWAGSEGARWA